MTNLIPLLRKELRVIARQRRTFWLRAGALALLSLLMIPLLIQLVVQAQKGYGVKQVSEVLFQMFVWTQFALLCLGAPAFSAGSITNERRLGTIDLLKLAAIRAPTLTIGKLLGAAALPFLLVMSEIPFLFVWTLFGGIAPEAIAATLALSASITVLLIAMALLTSALTRSSGISMVVSYLLALTYLFAPLWGHPFFPRGFEGWFIHIALYHELNPANVLAIYPWWRSAGVALAASLIFSVTAGFFVSAPRWVQQIQSESRERSIRLAIGGGVIGAALIAAAIALAVTGIVLGPEIPWAGYLLSDGWPRYLLVYAPAFAGIVVMGRGVVSAGRLFQSDSRKSRRVWGQPVLWREIYCGGGKRVTTFLNLVTMASIGCFIAATFVDDDTAKYILGGITLALPAVAGGVLGSISVSLEKEGGSIASLLLTPGSATTVILGKFAGACARTLPLVIVPFLLGFVRLEQTWMWGSLSAGLISLLLISTGVLFSTVFAKSAVSVAVTFAGTVLYSFCCCNMFAMLPWMIMAPTGADGGAEKWIVFAITCVLYAMMVVTVLAIAVGLFESRARDAS